MRDARYELIMQNKPNFLKAEMNASFVRTKGYENENAIRPPKKQTQSNPIFVPLVLFIVYKCLQALTI